MAKLQLFLKQSLRNYFLFFEAHYRAVGGQSKMAKPFWTLGRRCGVSEANTARADFLKNISVPILPIFKLVLFFFKLFVSSNVILRCPLLACNALRLHAGGGIGKVRTRAESNCPSQSVGRVAPPLA